MPMNLTIEISKPKVIESLIKQEYTTALIASLQLGEEELTRDVLMRIPCEEIITIVQQIQGKELILLINLLGLEFGRNIELGFLMVWVKEICKAHSKKLRGRSELRNMLRNIMKKYKEIAWMTQDNTYLLQYLSR